MPASLTPKTGQFAALPELEDEVEDDVEEELEPTVLEVVEPVPVPDAAAPVVRRVWPLMMVSLDEQLASPRIKNDVATTAAPLMAREVYPN